MHFYTYTSLSMCGERPQLCCKGNLHLAAIAVSDGLLGGRFIHTSNGTEGSEVNNRGDRKKKGGGLLQSVTFRLV